MSYHNRFNKKKSFVPGTELKRPSNINHYDDTVCLYPTQKIGNYVNNRCNQSMRLLRVVDLPAQFQHSDVICKTINHHRVQSRQMYVAICTNVDGHHDKGYNLACSVCLENIPFHWGANVQINKNAYSYVPKRRH